MTYRLQMIKNINTPKRPRDIELERKRNIYKHEKNDININAMFY